MLIGMNQLHKTRYEMMWQEYEVSKKKYDSQYEQAIAQSI
jgi:hypothetical protein